ncbi:RidA family protein [Chitinivorax sp. B]|uniref:RidA family protein n=1 Tax=Chitinivorax sp. B TaxID=2502235 RepID=UPI0010F9CC39|nr:RidA family protein [Chitinivorax sp. B]
MHDLSVSTTTTSLTMLNPAGLYDPSANGYSHVAMVPPGTRLAFIAGQGGETADGTLVDDFQQQVRQAFLNLTTAVTAAGGRMGQVAKLTVLIVDHSEQRLAVLSDEVKRVWGTAPAPACSLIPVPRLALDGMLFEVDAVVAIPA